MGLFRIIIIFILGYLVFKFIKRFISPRPPDPHVKGRDDKPSKYKSRNDIQDIDYEDIE